jgi:hypothetical protein
MPLCLIQSLPGTIRPLSDSLSVVIPDVSKEVSYGVSPLRRKEVREGRCSWHSDSIESGESLCIDELATLCAHWREQGLFSFIEIRLKGPLGSAEEDSIQRLAHVVDWLIVDGSSEVASLPGGLEIERWTRLVVRLRQATRRVGVRLGLSKSLPEEALRPWIAQLALELGEPGFLFVEGATLGESVSVLRGVQDCLCHHALSKGSARLMPIVRSVDHLLGDRHVELLDVPSLDALVIESIRPFFGGIAVAQGGGEPLFGRSLWQMVVSMIADRSSAISLLCYNGMSRARASELMRRIYALGWAIRQGECQDAVTHLEKLVCEIDQEMVFGGEKMGPLRELVRTLIDQAREIVGQRSPKHSVFGF